MAARETPPPPIDDAGETAYDTGYAEGYAIGWEDGYDAGQTDARAPWFVPVEEAP